MTPEEYQRAKAKLTRYNHPFDISVQSKLPLDVVKTKAGKVAKRQPTYNKQPKSYYQAQCSFRGLKTSGTIDDLQLLLQQRDAAKDLTIRDELQQVRERIAAYDEEQQNRRYEEWWANASTKFEEKLSRDAHRALSEELKQPDSLLRTSCRVFNISLNFDAIRTAATQLGIGYEQVRGPVDLPPGSLQQRYHVVGEPKQVRQQAAAFLKRAEQKAASDWTAYRAQQAAKQKAKEEAAQVLLAEARATEDWDITGKWMVHCDQMATYSSGTPQPLTMEIFEDTYKLDSVCGDVYGEEDSYGEEDPAAVKKRKEPENAAAAQHRRFNAKFDFAVIEGIMRIYPPASTVKHSPPLPMKRKPVYEYRWRGRETGESQIEAGAEEHLRTITFSEHGTKLEGVFDCPYSGVAHFHSNKGQAWKRSEEFEWL